MLRMADQVLAAAQHGDRIGVRSGLDDPVQHRERLRERGVEGGDPGVGHASIVAAPTDDSGPPESFPVKNLRFFYHALFD